MCVRVLCVALCDCVTHCHFSINFPSKWQLNYVFIDFAVFKYALSLPTYVTINCIVGNAACRMRLRERERNIRVTGLFQFNNDLKTTQLQFGINKKKLQKKLIIYIVMYYN